jgi:hypothetical protein
MQIGVCHSGSEANAGIAGRGQVFNVARKQSLTMRAYGSASILNENG